MRKRQLLISRYCRSNRSTVDLRTTTYPDTVGIESVLELLIESLGTVFDAEESVIIERLLREYGGTIPDSQLVSEMGLALAIHRRQTGTGVG